MAGGTAINGAKKAKMGVGRAGKGEYIWMECVLKELIGCIKYRKRKIKGEAKGGKRRDGMVRKGQGRGQVGRMAVGTHMAKGSQTGSSNVLSITRGA